MPKILIVILALFLQACAFTDATLPVSHDPEANAVGPISELSKLYFQSPEIDDSRMVKERIGWKKNGYGQQTADIYTEAPVDKIIEDAIIDAIGDNGHSIEEGAPLKVTGTVNRFWFEVDTNFWTVEFIGDVQCTINFIDTSTNETIYSSDYSGTNKKKTGGGLEKTWTEVMGKAIDNFIEGIVYDEDLAEALEVYRGQSNN